MATNNILNERAFEIRAAAEAGAIVRILADASTQPSGKKFTRSRDERIGRWLQLEAVARAQVGGLQALARAPLAPNSVRLTPAPGAPVSDSEPLNCLPDVPVDD